MSLHCAGQAWRWKRKRSHWTSDSAGHFIVAFATWIMFLAREMHSRLRRHISLLMHIVPPAAAMLFQCRHIVRVAFLPCCTMCHTFTTPYTSQPVGHPGMRAAQWPARCNVCTCATLFDADAAARCTMHIVSQPLVCAALSFDCTSIVAARARCRQDHHHGGRLAAQPRVPQTTRTRACSRLLHCIHPPMLTCSPCCFWKPRQQARQQERQRQCAAVVCR